MNPLSTKVHIITKWHMKNIAKAWEQLFEASWPQTLGNNTTKITLAFDDIFYHPIEWYEVVIKRIIWIWIEISISKDGQIEAMLPTTTKKSFIEDEKIWL